MSAPTRPAWRDLAAKAWPHVVAAFVLFQIAANVVDVVPDVSLGMTKKAWKEPRVKDELDRWAARLGVERHAFEDELWSLGATEQAARKIVRAPFATYLDVTGQHQVWAMFIAGTRARDRFQVRSRACAVDDACDWTVLYDRADPAHDFMRSTLDEARVRSAIFRWGWPQAQTQYRRGCHAIAARAFAADPSAAVVECRFERSLAPDPRRDERTGADHTGAEWGRSLVVTRAALEAAP